VSFVKEFPLIPIGTMVTIEAPGGRGDNGLTRTIPAVVLGQWATGEVQLYALHFEGSFLMNAVPWENIKIVGSDKPLIATQPMSSALFKKFNITRDAS
jgi:hypothetical protein